MTIVKRFIQSIIGSLARQVVKKYQPEIIAITGSVGKTTTKEAIATVLRSCFFTRAADKNYNNEFGVPLTIIGSNSPGRSLIGWWQVYRQAKKLLQANQEYPLMLVLEMGVDRPGDMDYLTQIARPSRAVITRLGSAHVEFFSSLEALHKEKLRLATALQPEGVFIYNFEDEKLRTASKTLPMHSLSYGFSEGADVRTENLNISFGNNEVTAGVTFKLMYHGSAVPVFIPGVVSRPAVLSVLAAAAVGFSYDMNALEIAGALKTFSAPAGRLRLLAGLRETLLLDDTYNASPEAVIESLETLMAIPSEHYRETWAVLGDMRELGKESESAHQKIGALCASKKIDHLVTVGEMSSAISEAAQEEGMKKEQVRHFQTSEEAAAFLKDTIQSKDVLLIKGSQAVRLEKVVKALLANPAEAEKVLVRQGKEWQA